MERTAIFGSGGRARRTAVIESVTAGVVFALSLAAFLLSGRLHARGVAWVAALVFFILLIGGYLAFSVDALRKWLAALPATPLIRQFAGPVLLLGAVTAYSAASGLDIALRLAVYVPYLLVPAALLFPWRPGNEAAAVSALAPTDAASGVQPTRPWLLALLAVAVFWLPLQLHLLPPLPLPAPGGYDVAKLVALLAAMWLFLVARPLDGIGYTFRVGARNAARGAGAVLAYAVVALPIGLLTGFLFWRPDLTSTTALLSPLYIYLLVAVPEEFLFRGLIQNLLQRRLGEWPALAIAAVIFGLAHLPDVRYALLAALAGVAYGWVYMRTGRITASAITHAGVDWIWVLLLGA